MSISRPARVARTACTSIALMLPATVLAQGRFVDLGASSGFDQMSLSTTGTSALAHVAYTGARRWSHVSGPSWFEPAGLDISTGSSLHGARLSADAATIVFTGLPAGGGSHDDQRAYVWTAQGGVQRLPTPVAHATGVAFTTGVSADGAVIVGQFETLGFFNQEACRWTTSGAFVPLGDLPGGNVLSHAYGVSANGDVIVGNSAVAFISTPFGIEDVFGGFVWTPGTGILPVRQPAEAFSVGGVSGDGQVIVGSGDSIGLPGARVAQRKVAGQPVADLLAPIGSSHAIASSFDGGTIVGYVQSGAVAGHSLYTGPFVWRAAHGAQALSDALVAAGVALPGGFVLTQVRAVSSDGNAFIGAGRDALNVSRAWLAFLSEPDLALGVAECAPARPNSTGSAGGLGLAGLGFVAGGEAVLTATALPPGAACVFLAAQTAGHVVHPGGSQGVLCLGGSIGRFAAPSEIRVADLGGAASLALDLAWIPQPNGRVAIQSGETWRFQCWYRDLNPAPTSNFTHAVAEHFE